MDLNSRIMKNHPPSRETQYKLHINSIYIIIKFDFFRRLNKNLLYLLKLRMIWQLYTVFRQLCYTLYGVSTAVLFVANFSTAVLYVANFSTAVLYSIRCFDSCAICCQLFQGTSRLHHE